VLFVAFPVLLGAVCGVVFHLTIGFEWMNNGLKFWAFVFVTVSLPIWLYFSLYESSPHQATIGMRAMGLQVADLAGERISFGRALLRTVLKLLPFEINHLTMFLPRPIWGDPNPGFRVGFLLVSGLMGLYLVIMFMTRRKQSLHDLVAGTVVLERNNAASGLAAGHPLRQRGSLGY
jgi:uncharacterized RDD family membrane protein YckC